MIGMMKNFEKPLFYGGFGGLVKGSIPVSSFIFVPTKTFGKP